MDENKTPDEELTDGLGMLDEELTLTMLASLACTTEGGMEAVTEEAAVCILTWANSARLQSVLLGLVEDGSLDVKYKEDTKEVAFEVTPEGKESMLAYEKSNPLVQYIQGL